VAEGAGKGITPSLLNFNLSDNFFVVGKSIFSKKTKYAPENLTLGVFSGKVEILSIRGFLCRKFAAVC